MYSSNDPISCNKYLKDHPTSAVPKSKVAQSVSQLVSMTPIELSSVCRLSSGQLKTELGAKEQIAIDAHLPSFAWIPRITKDYQAPFFLLFFLGNLKIELVMMRQEWGLRSATKAHWWAPWGDLVVVVTNWTISTFALKTASHCQQPKYRTMKHKISDLDFQNVFLRIF